MSAAKICMHSASITSDLKGWGGMTEENCALKDALGDRGKEGDLSVRRRGGRKAGGYQIRGGKERQLIQKRTTRSWLEQLGKNVRRPYRMRPEEKSLEGGGGGM